MPTIVLRCNCDNKEKSARCTVCGTVHDCPVRILDAKGEGSEHDRAD